ncbi:hypothetical protein Pan44_19110 [Caulifigura coniformis]|uniref:Uncharacterized protein n=1 Tax=Caulifigura coniformis TaxID=2527983 RepID=A0A517SCP8_9PLAN|nr:hypothetical protein [Caulifigura coniformis]QDT53885.1 hypothetical protein Pan44_19110 [Caulifigura coniformis]
MSLLDAVKDAGVLPIEALQSEKKRYSERLSAELARQMAAGLRQIGFDGTKPLPGGPGERAFQGGLGPKKVDVSYADEQHGLKLAVSIKTITSPPYGKNLKNRFYDLCPEGITLHLRFPYSVICALFCLPVAANQDTSAGRKVSTFERARKLLSTISGRREYTDPGEKFEDIAMLLFQPLTDDPATQPWVKVVDALTNREMTEAEYFESIRQIYNRRNPHAAIGEDMLDLDSGETMGE